MRQEWINECPNNHLLNDFYRQLSPKLRNFDTDLLEICINYKFLPIFCLQIAVEYHIKRTNTAATPSKCLWQKWTDLESIAKTCRLANNIDFLGVVSPKFHETAGAKSEQAELQRDDTTIASRASPSMATRIFLWLTSIDSQDIRKPRKIFANLITSTRIEICVQALLTSLHVAIDSTGTSKLANLGSRLIILAFANTARVNHTSPGIFHQLHFPPQWICPFSGFYFHRINRFSTFLTNVVKTNFFGQSRKLSKWLNEEQKCTILVHFDGVYSVNTQNRFALMHHFGACAGQVPAILGLFSIPITAVFEQINLLRNIALTHP